MDIWHTAQPGREDVETGWLGRVVDDSRDATYALHLANEPLPLSLHAERIAVPSIADIDVSVRSRGLGCGFIVKWLSRVLPASGPARTTRRAAGFLQFAVLRTFTLTSEEIEIVTRELGAALPE